MAVYCKYAVENTSKLPNFRETKSIAMKKLFTLLAITIFLAPVSIAQEEGQNEEVEVTKTMNTFFMKTPPLRVLMQTAATVPDGYYDGVISEDKRHTPPSWGDQELQEDSPANNGVDEAIQTAELWRDGSGMTKANFQGNGGALPPDPSGAVGIDHYVQAVNLSYRIFNKDGTPASNAMFLSQMWPGSINSGDPIVMYDRYADRWFVSQFQTNDNSILIAISETSDPLGQYFLYEFTFSQFPDYPKFAVWSNAYFMTANTSSTDCVAYERDKMLVGDPSASMIAMYFPNIPYSFPSIAPAYAEGLWEPEIDEPGWAFAVQDSYWPGVTEDHIKVMKITLDWVTPSNSNVNIHQSINTASFNGQFQSNWEDLTQPGTTQKLDALPGIFMYRAQYRRFAGYDVMMLVHTVDVNNNNRAGVRWYELRKDDGSDQWYIFQESTFDPNDGNSRWMGNAGMDINGNIGLAYSTMGPSEFAGIRYTGRYAIDPLNTMTVQEQIAVSGEGAQPTQMSGMRFGDYSQMTIDPTDDATFWFTGEWLGPGGSKRTQIFSFAMWELAGEEEAPPAKPYFNSYQPNPDQLTITWNDLKDDQFDITITDMNGKLIAIESNVDATLGQMIFDVPSNATGIYIVSLVGENTQMSDKAYFAR